jgi:hypothetical protein
MKTQAEIIARLELRTATLRSLEKGCDCLEGCIEALEWVLGIESPCDYDYN